MVLLIGEIFKLQKRSEANEPRLQFHWEIQKSKNVSEESSAELEIISLTAFGTTLGAKKKPSRLSDINLYLVLFSKVWGGIPTIALDLLSSAVVSLYKDFVTN
ncbi:hypothetical protein QE152_g27300 [Popillia japonica]|uniref:Uncharacterized protein n=1 Tax=Popillia japonica TaxID=7064 RepID=A0AAW1JV50_POPJA